MRAFSRRWALALVALALIVASASAQQPPVGPAAPAAPQAALADPAPAGSVAPTALDGDLLWNVVRPRLSAGYNSGPGFGYSNGYSSFGAFVPLMGDSTNHLIYIDARGLISDFQQNWGNNLGLGYRYYSPSMNRIFGVWNSWDLRNTGVATYNQISGGLESMGRNLDFNANYYVVAGPQFNQTGSVFINAPSFQGNNILLPNVTTYQAALSGTDMEVGGPVPMLSQYGLRGYAGGYAFHADTYGNVAGVQTRLFARLNNNMDMNLQVRSDNAFGTTLAVGGAIRWGGVRPQYQSPDRTDVFNRFADPVVRNYNVSVLNKSEGSNQLALNPATNQPLTIVFVNNTAAAGGNGTFLHPLNTLAPASALAGTNGIIALEPGNLTTAGQNAGIVLLNGQHLLGTGVANNIVAQQGTFTLPTIGTGTPVITNTAGDGITLANNNEVANLAIVGALNNGINGTGISGFNIHGVSIAGAGVSTGSGILLTDAAGTGTISNVSATFMGNEGLTIVQNTGTLGVNVLNSSFNNNSSDGITLTTNNSAVLSVLVQGGSKIGNGGSGINATSNNASTLNLQVVNDPITNNAVSGITLTSNSTSTLNANISGSTITNNASDGITATGNGSSSLNLTATSNNVSNNGAAGTGDGINVTLAGPANGPAQNVTLTGNTANNEADSGIIIRMTGGSSQTLTANNNTTNGNPNFGIDAQQFNSAGAQTMTMNGNTANANGNDGLIGLQFTAGTTQIMTMNGNTASGNSNDGLIGQQFTAGSSQTMTMNNNAANGNGNDGYVAQQFSAGTTQNMTMSNNVGNVNGNDGIVAQQFAAGTAQAMTITGNTTSGNGNDGIVAQSSTAGTAQTMTITGNTTSGNGNDGIVAQSSTAGTAQTMTMNGNTANSNGGVGLLAEQDTSANETMTVNNNIAIGNGSDGIDVIAFGTALTQNVSGNTASTNGGFGINVFNSVDSGSSTISNNTTSANASAGINIDDESNNITYSARGNSMTGDNSGGTANGAFWGQYFGSGTMTLTMNQNSNSPGAGNPGYAFTNSGNIFNVNFFGNGGGGNTYNGVAVPGPAPGAPPSIVNAGATIN